MNRVSLDHPLFQEAIPLLKKMENLGYEAYFVGGAVRDTLLELPIHDIDIATDATPEEIKRHFRSTIDVGIEHGTVIVIFQGRPYEMTTFRTEGTYSDYRRPDQVHYVRDLEEDTLRRDFTINAMAIDRFGVIYDYHDGMTDLKDGVIRAVGEPYERFNEDALRMLRAVRFSSQLGFSVEEQTLKAIQTLSPLIEKIAMERIQIEWEKFFQGLYIHKQGQTIISSQLLNHLPFPSLTNRDNLIELTVKDMSLLVDAQMERSSISIWGLLIYHQMFESKNSLHHWLRTWKLSNQLIDQACSFASLRKLSLEQLLDPLILYQSDKSVLALLEDFYLANGQLTERKVSQQMSQLPIQSRQEMVIDGKKIMALLNIDRGGPIVGYYLSLIEEKILKRQLLNEEKAIQQYIQHLLEEG